MKTNRAAAAIVLSVQITGCLMPVQPVSHVTIDAPWDDADAQARLAPGTAQIRGNALWRQQGGGVVTCAGREVRLIPVTDYARERVTKVFYFDAERERGYLPASAMNRPTEYVPDVSGFKARMRAALCDAQGGFVFDRRRAGEYYVVTTVLWQVGYSDQGGALAQRVVILEGENKSIVLAPR